MDTNKLMELLKRHAVLEKEMSEIRAEIAREASEDHTVQEVEHETEEVPEKVRKVPKVSRETSTTTTRQRNRMDKEILMKLFKRYPKRVFSASRLRSSVKGTATTMRQQLAYLVTANFIEKVGNSWRYKNPSEKVTNEVDQKIFEVLNKPMTLRDLRIATRTDYYVLRSQVRTLEKLGRIKAVTLDRINAKGHRRKSICLVTSDYQEPAQQAA